MLKLAKTNLAPCSQRILENIISSLGYSVLLFVILICQFKLHKYGVHCTYKESAKILNNNSNNNAGQLSSLSRIYQVIGDGDDYLNETQQYNDQRTQQRQTIREKRSKFNDHTNHYQNDQPAILEKCCACDEAKYELVFEGLWSRYTHPDNFPENYWLAHFSDVIGASHSNDFRIWAEDQFATEGVKEVAQSGSTKKLESELKQVSSKIRTIIKARELRYPILNSRTFAVFRTDRHHHLVSILSKLGPSPDWMVGVSGLELCQADCSWTMQRVVNLHLWDAGTDSGESFTAPDSPKMPQDTIRPFKRTISLRNENDNNANQQQRNGTFDNQNKQIYDENQTFSSPAIEQLTTTTTSKPQSAYSNEPSKPFARLIITRQRIYEKACSDHEDTSFSSIPTHQGVSRPETDTISEYPITSPSYADCRFTDWSDWSSCSSNCGKGIRTRIRSFINDNAYLNGCSRSDLIEKEICLSECFGSTTCVTRDWSEWSDCSVSCGQGYRQRTRSLIGPFKKVCTSSIDLIEREACIGHLGMDCTDDVDESASGTSASNCKLSEWSSWSECSASCGKGTKVRTRQYKNRESYKVCSAKLSQKAPCTGRNSAEVCANQTKEICSKLVDAGPCKTYVERWYYDKDKCACVKFQYGGCFGNKNNFERYKDCVRICLPQTNKEKKEKDGSSISLEPVDCILDSWGSWSPCSSNCKRTRHRKILQRPRNGGRSCDKLVKTQRCQNCHHPGNDTNNQKHSNNNNQQLKDSHQIDNNTTKLDQNTNNPSCVYQDWTPWSECEVICKPVKIASNKVRRKLPFDDMAGKCIVIEELYYCDPNIYC